MSKLVVEHVAPTVRRVLAYKLQFYVGQGASKFKHPDAEEVYNDIHVCFLKRLRDLKAAPADKPIINLRGYITVIARNACDEYLRRKYPQRRYLKDKIRHQLTGQQDFTLWEDPEQGWLVGLALWGRRSGVSLDEALLARLRTYFTEVDASRLKLHDLLTLVLRACGGPVEFDSLTDIIATTWGIEDRPAESFDCTHAAQLVDTEAPPDVVIEYRQLLAQLWVEIGQLPRRQRAALLLNLRNPQGVNVITLLPATGLATLEDIAAMLEMPVEQLVRLWPELPLDDLRIAAYLGATRQQVINLRKNARERLARRMKLYGGRNDGR